MATDMNGAELPTKPLPNVPPPDIELLLSAMENMEAKHVPACVAFFGDQGSWKSTSAMKFLRGIMPEDEYILYFDTAANWTSLMNFPELMQRVKRVQFERMEQLLAYAAAIKSGVGPFKRIGAVVLDEYSNMTGRDHAWIVDVRAKQVNEDGKRFKDPFQPEQSDYLALKNRSLQVINAFMDLGIHVIFIAHERQNERIITVPDMPKGTANDFQRLIHGVYHCTVEQDEKKNLQGVLQLQPVGKISAKNRIGGLGTYCTVEQLIGAYKQWGIGGNEKKQAPSESQEMPAPLTQETDALEFLGALEES